MTEHDALYFGCWGGTGHYTWTPQAQMAWGVPDWMRHEVGYLLAPVLGPVDYSKPWSEQQPQSLARLHHLHGWTALAMWDRTVDGRGNANSVFLLRGELTFEAVARLAAERFPAVWSRISPIHAHRGRPADAVACAASGEEGGS